jgi:hypothetical protein
MEEKWGTKIRLTSTTNPYNQKSAYGADATWTVRMMTSERRDGDDRFSLILYLPVIQISQVYYSQFTGCIPHFFANTMSVTSLQYLIYHYCLSVI